MARAVEADTHSEYPRAKIPRPVKGGTDSVQSLGRLIDNLLGDARDEAAADRKLEPMLLPEEEMPPDPPPAEIPDPLPRGDEEITKGGKPDA